MNIKQLIVTGIVSLFLSVSLFAQTIIKSKTISPAPAVQRALSGFPELEFTSIPGAPKLSKPVLITGSELPIVSEGMGLAAPAFYDWDGDGIKDLLIGEFGSGLENGRMMGNFVRLYKNEGTNEKPLFSGSWNYIGYNFDILSDGTPISVEQGCCIGFSPQFVDLNGDGQLDMVTGQYQGEVSWFPKGDKGFEHGRALPQYGEVRGKDWEKYQDYFLYSSASFGDFNGDGLPDMVTGGSSLRLAVNNGTKEQPSFGKRDTLLTINGQPLKMRDFTPAEIKENEMYLKLLGQQPSASGTGKICPYVVDWDNDGVLDILATNAYIQSGLYAVVFFKGVNTDKGIRFQPAVPLFTAKNGGKEFPGSGPKIFVCDYNNDGVKDLLIGASVVTTNGEFNDLLSWNWETDMHIQSAGKDAGNLHLDAAGEKSQREYYLKHGLPEGISIEEYMTIKHEGYVYVLLGKK